MGAASGLARRQRPPVRGPGSDTDNAPWPLSGKLILPTATSSAPPSATLKPRRHTSSTLLSPSSAFTSTQLSSVSRPPTPPDAAAAPPRRSNCTASAGLLTAQTCTSFTAVLRADSWRGERNEGGSG